MSLAKTLSSLIRQKGNEPLLSDSPSIDFIRTRKGILKELLTSRDHETIIGVYSRVFGEGMFLVAVKDIEYLSKGEVVIFYPYDLSGKKLSRSRVLHDEIQMVCPFNKVFRDSMLRGSGTRTAILESQSIFSL